MKRKKYTTGAYVSSYIKDPYAMLMENQQNIAEASHEAATDPIVMGLKYLSTQTDAMVPEVEKVMNMLGVPSMETGGKVKRKEKRYVSRYGKNTSAFINSLINRKEFENYSGGDFDKMLLAYEYMETKGKNINQDSGGPGQGYFQIENKGKKNDSFQVAKNRLEDYSENFEVADLNLNSYNVNDVKKLSRDLQAALTLANTYKQGRGRETYFNPREIKKNWLDYHTVSGQKEKGQRWDNETKELEKFSKEKFDLKMPEGYKERMNNSRYGGRPNKDGTHSSHLMSSGSRDDKFIAYPTLFQNLGQWEELRHTDAIKRAETDNEIFEFDKEWEADVFAKGAWKREGPMYNTGGVTGEHNIEVEGGELVQEPGKEPEKIVGAKHDKGGVNINVEDGTKIYSEKYGINNESFANRKTLREQKAKKAINNLNKDPFNILLANTLTRTRETNEIEDKFDMMFQQELHEKQNSKIQPQAQNKDSFETGGYPRGKGYVFNNNKWGQDYFYQYEPDNATWTYWDKNKPTDEWQSLNEAGIRNVETSWMKDGNILQNDAIENFTPIKTMKSKPFEDLLSSKYGEIQIDEKGGLTEVFGEPKERWFDKLLGNIKDGASNQKLGNTIGTLANIYGIVAPFANTEANRAATPANVNHYKGFGEDALKANQEAMAYSKTVLDGLYREVDEQTATAKKSNRASSRSINTSRVLDSLVDTKAMRSKEQSSFRFLQQIAQLYNSQSQLENIQDKMVMSGENTKDIANRRDTDNYYTQRAVNIANAANLGQGLAGNLNQMSYDDKMEQLLQEYKDNPDLSTLLKILGIGGQQEK